MTTLIYKKEISDAEITAIAHIHKEEKLENESDLEFVARFFDDKLNNLIAHESSYSAMETMKQNLETMKTERIVELAKSKPELIRVP